MKRLLALAVLVALPCSVLAARPMDPPRQVAGTYRVSFYVVSGPDAIRVTQADYEKAVPRRAVRAEVARHAVARATGARRRSSSRVRGGLTKEPRLRFERPHVAGPRRNPGSSLAGGGL